MVEFTKEDIAQRPSITNKVTISAARGTALRITTLRLHAVRVSKKRQVIVWSLCLLSIFSNSKVPQTVRSNASAKTLDKVAKIIRT